MCVLSLLFGNKRYKKSQSLCRINMVCMWLSSEARDQARTASFDFRWTTLYLFLYQFPA